MSINNPLEEYLYNLRNTASCLGKQKIRTLQVQFYDTLLKLPALKTEIDFILAQEGELDYDSLILQLESSLHKATEFLLKMDLLPAEIRHDEVMLKFVDMLGTTLKSGTVDFIIKDYYEIKDKLEQKLQAKIKNHKTDSAWQNARQDADNNKRNRTSQAIETDELCKYLFNEIIAGFCEVKGGEYYFRLRGENILIHDMKIARYPVTNKQYRLFIDYLNGQASFFEDRFPLKKFIDRLEAISKNGEWDGWYRFADYIMEKECRLVERFKSGGNSHNVYKQDMDDFWWAFQRLTHYQPERILDEPVSKISWYDARAYCLWLSLVESNGADGDLYRLPTSEEWLWAASGGGKRMYPWGNETPDSSLVINGGAYKQVRPLSPVGSHPAGSTPEGLCDMVGNVYEWQLNWWNDWHSDINKKELCVLRGTTHPSPHSLRCEDAISNDEPGSKNNGFRIVRQS